MDLYLVEHEIIYNFISHKMKKNRLTDISSSKYFGMLYKTAIPTDVGMRNFFQLNV